MPPRPSADRAAAIDVLRRDPVLRRVIDRVGTPPDYYRERSDFRTASRIVVGQQLSYAAATTIWNRVVALAPRWTPSEVARIAPARLRAAGLSGSKTGFIREAARRVEAGEIDFRRIRRLDDDAAAEALRDIKGFGPWSAEMFLIFGLGREDVFSVGDAGLRRAVTTLYRVPGGSYERRVAEIAARWRPHRSLASRILWAWLDHAAE